MNSIASKIIAVIMSVLILSYVGYQAFNKIYNPYEYEIVKPETYIQDIDLNGFFIRNEKAIDVKKEGVISYRFNNAEKVSKSTVIANVYNSEKDLQNLRKVEKLKKEKEILVKSQDKQYLEGLKIDALNRQVNTYQDELISLVDSKQVNNLSDTYNALLLNMNRLETLKDSSLTFQTQIDNLEKEINQTSANITKENKTVISNESGYFSSHVDGYESLLARDMLKDLSVKKVQDVIINKKAIKTDNIGKIQYDFTWDFVALIDAKKADLFKENSVITLKFHSKSIKEVPVTIKKVIIEKNNASSVVVFTSDILDADFTSMRFEKAKAVINKYGGVVIPKDAIRFEKVTENVVDEETQTAKVVEKDVKGVYVLLGKAVQFREVNVIYEDNYYVVSRMNSNPRYVNFYDKVIIKGKNLNGTTK